MPIYSEKFVIYYRKDMGINEIESIDDLRGLRIGTIRGWSYGDAFDDAVKHNSFEIQENISEKHNINMLKYGRLDALIAIEESSDLIIQELGLTNIIGKSDYSLNLDIYMAFNKMCSKQNDIKRINEIISEFILDGTISRIEMKVITLVP